MASPQESGTEGEVQLIQDPSRHQGGRQSGSPQDGQALHAEGGEMGAGGWPIREGQKAIEALGRRGRGRGGGEEQPALERLPEEGQLGGEVA